MKKKKKYSCNTSAPVYFGSGVPGLFSSRIMTDLLRQPNCCHAGGARRGIPPLDKRVETRVPGLRALHVTVLYVTVFS